MIEEIFQEEKTWEEFFKETEERDGWVFRGQPDDDPLTTSLERALNDYKIPLLDSPDIEKYMKRDFRRRYEGNDRNLVIDDTLYCLSLMRHHGAPTRLLDWTYSPYVAAFFAVEKIKLNTAMKNNFAIVYCLCQEWCKKMAEKNVKAKRIFQMRYTDNTMTDKSFCPLYMKNKYNFVLLDNPMSIHKRLFLHKGTFLIPGNIRISTMDNIKSMENWNNKKNIKKIKIRIKNKEEIEKIYSRLRLMNISNESLFPGLDGFSRSLKQNMFYYIALSKNRAGKGN